MSEYFIKWCVVCGHEVMTSKTDQEDCRLCTGPMERKPEKYAHKKPSDSEPWSGGFADNN